MYITKLAAFPYLLKFVQFYFHLHGIPFVNIFGLHFISSFFSKYFHL